MMKELTPLLGPICVAIIVLGVNGCDKKKRPVDGPPPTIALPVEVPAADAEPVKKDVIEAHGTAVQTQQSIEKVLAKPGPESLGELSTARNTASQTVQTLERAKDKDVPELERQLAAETANRHIAEAALKTNQENALKDASNLREVVKDRDDEIAKLKNEELRWIKWALGIASAIFFVGGIVCAVGGSMYGFVSGWKIAAIAWPCGALCGMLAVYLNEIILAALWATIAAVVLVVGWIAWRFFHHDPALTHEAIAKRKGKTAPTVSVTTNGNVGYHKQP
jgi:hypothetical protein